MKVNFHWTVLWFGLTGRVSLWMGLWHGHRWHLTHFISSSFCEGHALLGAQELTEFLLLLWPGKEEADQRDTRIPQDIQWNVFYISPFFSGWTGHVYQDLLCWQYLQQQKVMYFHVKSLSPSMRKFLKVPTALQVSINVHLPSNWQGFATVKCICEVIPLALTRCSFIIPPFSDVHVQIFPLKVDEHIGCGNIPLSTWTFSKVMVYFIVDFILKLNKWVNSQPPVSPTVWKIKGSELFFFATASITRMARSWIKTFIPFIWCF